MTQQKTLEKCNVCGEEFDATNLYLVMLHEHRDDLDPSLAIGKKGRKVDAVAEHEWWANFNARYLK